MEHLIEPAELESFQSSIPKTPWLEFDHDTLQEYALVGFPEYPLQRGYTAK